MHERHTNKEKYFNEQAYTSEKYVIPFLADQIKINKDTSILEIGCGEGGNLKPFLDLGCKRVVGIDLSKGKIEQANIMFAKHPNKGNIEFIHADIYEINDLGEFDIILTRDVLEHIHGQEKFMEFVKKFLKPHGKFFLGFPPWYNPFGGHQQICESRILSKLPFFHILPKNIYKLILIIFGESAAKIRALLEIKETGITIDRFEKILRKTKYKIDKRFFYFINPNYEIKFKLKPREQLKILASIPFIRNFIITASYYIVSTNRN
jgi:SAM-dependent methyltransferase